MPQGIEQLSDDDLLQMAYKHGVDVPSILQSKPEKKSASTENPITNAVDGVTAKIPDAISSAKNSPLLKTISKIPGLAYQALITGAPSRPGHEPIEPTTSAQALAPLVIANPETMEAAAEIGSGAIDKVKNAATAAFSKPNKGVDPFTKKPVSAGEIAGESTPILRRLLNYIRNNKGKILIGGGIAAKEGKELFDTIKEKLGAEYE